MIKNEEKRQEVLKTLINKQLEPHGVSYEDVLDEPEWFLKYSTTQEQEEEFKKWGVELIRKELKMTKKQAKDEMEWFILQFGLTIED